MDRDAAPPPGSDVYFFYIPGPATGEKRSVARSESDANPFQIAMTNVKCMLYRSIIRDDIRLLITRFGGGRGDRGAGWGVWADVLGTCGPGTARQPGLTKVGIRGARAGCLQ